MLSGLFQVCVYSWLCCQELKLYEGCVSMYDAEVVVMNHLNEVLYYCVVYCNSVFVHSICVLCLCNLSNIGDAICDLCLCKLRTEKPELINQNQNNV
jgi:hypothetical protein